MATEPVFILMAAMMDLLVAMALPTAQRVIPSQDLLPFGELLQVHGDSPAIKMHRRPEATKQYVAACAQRLLSLSASAAGAS